MWGTRDQCGSARQAVEARVLGEGRPGPRHGRERVRVPEERKAELEPAGGQIDVEDADRRVAQRTASRPKTRPSVSNMSRYPRRTTMWYRGGIIPAAGPSPRVIVNPRARPSSSGSTAASPLHDGVVNCRTTLPFSFASTRKRGGSVTFTEAVPSAVRSLPARPQRGAWLCLARMSLMSQGFRVTTRCITTPDQASAPGTTATSRGSRHTGGGPPGWWLGAR